VPFYDLLKATENSFGSTTKRHSTATGRTVLNNPTYKLLDLPTDSPPL